MTDGQPIRRGDMSQPLVYIDTSEVREGVLDELKGAIEERCLTTCSWPQLPIPAAGSI